MIWRKLGRERNKTYKLKLHREMFCQLGYQHGQFVIIALSQLKHKSRFKRTCRHMEIQHIRERACRILESLEVNILYDCLP